MNVGTCGKWVAMMIIPLTRDYKRGNWVKANGLGKIWGGKSVRQRENTGKHWGKHRGIKICFGPKS